MWHRKEIIKAFKEIIEKYGVDIFKDRKKCVALCGDLLVAYEREQQVFQMLFHAGLGDMLGGIPFETEGELKKGLYRVENFLKKQSIEETTRENIMEVIMKISINNQENAALWLWELSDDIISLIEEKPFLWEYILYAKCLLYYDKELSDLKKEPIYDFRKYSEDGEKICDLGLLLNYVQPKVYQSIKIIEELKSINLEEAIGECENGDEEEIILVAKKIVGAYKKILLWKNSFTGIYVAPMYIAAIKTVYTSCDDIIQNLELLMRKAESGIVELEKCSKGQIEVAELHVDFSIQINQRIEDVTEELNVLCE